VRRVRALVERPAASPQSPGNHDRCFQERRAEAERLFPGTSVLIDSEAVVADLRIYGSPWQPAYNDWAYNLPRGPALAARWETIPRGLDVLVTHGPPHGLGDRTSHAGRQFAGVHTGCVDLAARVARVRPALHLFGHVHEDGGAWFEDGRLSANVTTWECERGCTVLDVDLGTRSAETVEVPPPGR
jgi:hypothetical protein